MKQLFIELRHTVRVCSIGYSINQKQHNVLILGAEPVKFCMRINITYHHVYSVMYAYLRHRLPSVL